jgi:two-component system, cell cycle response regulator DivK
MAGETILIVEDNPTNLKLSKLLLTIEGYEVRTAINAEEAIKVLTTFHPRLILMDLQLPGKNGLELTRELKSDPKFKDILIVALTAYAMKGDEEKATAAGCDGYMTKPVSAVTFPIEIAQYLSKQRALPKLD